MSDQIQWGVLVTLPNGAPDVEECSTRSHAVNVTANTNRVTGDAAKVVYRTVKHGEWTIDTVGDEWGFRETWPDGHVEIHPRRTRREAEATVRGSQLDTVRVVVSRTVQVSDWWLAEVTA